MVNLHLFYLIIRRYFPNTSYMAEALKVYGEVGGENYAVELHRIVPVMYPTRQTAFT